MIKYLKSFFYPSVIIYHYLLPKELVIAKITEILKRKITFLGSNDMSGSFLTGDTFAVNVISPAYTRGVKLGSTLVCQVTDLKNGATEIKIKTKPSSAFYFLFFAIA